MVRFSWPQIIGIVNITEDSFSDGGRFLDPHAAVRHAVRLYEAGADIVELGPASSHPDARRVTAEQECERLAPVLPRLTALGIPVSVDSFLPETQRFALASGVAMLNDIHGFPHQDMWEVVARADCRLVVTHSVQQGGVATRVDTDPDTIWERIEAFFTTRLEALQSAGVERERIVIDPGLGFFLGTNPQCSLTVLADLDRLRRQFERPVHISPSRKSFLQHLTGRVATQTGASTLAAELHAANQGADYIRTHDVAALHDGLTVLQGVNEARDITGKR